MGSLIAYSGITTKAGIRTQPKIPFLIFFNASHHIARNVVFTVLFFKKLFFTVVEVQSAPFRSGP